MVGPLVDEILCSVDYGFETLHGRDVRIRELLFSLQQMQDAGEAITLQLREMRRLAVENLQNYLCEAIDHWTRHGAYLETLQFTTEMSNELVRQALILSRTINHELCSASNSLAQLENYFQTLETTPQGDTVLEKCRKFLVNLLELTSREGETVGCNVRTLVQELVDSKVGPEEFCDRLGSLDASLRPCIVGFLKKSLPRLRQSMVTGELVIDGIRPPPADVICNQPTTVDQQQTPQEDLTRFQSFLPIFFHYIDSAKQRSEVLHRFLASCRREFQHFLTKWEQTERPGGNGPELEDVVMQMTISRDPMCRTVPPNTLHPYSDLPRTPPDLTAVVQRWLHESPFNQEMTMSSASTSTPMSPTNTPRTPQTLPPKKQRRMFEAAFDQNMNMPMPSTSNNPRHYGKDLPRIPPDLSAEVQQWINNRREESEEESTVWECQDELSKRS